MGLFLLPLGLLAGWMAGTAMSRRMIRQEVQRLESLIGRDGAKPAPAAPVTIPVAAPGAPAPAAAPKAGEPEKAEEISPDVILVLGAAVAAFLGKRARIKSARLVRAAPSNAWAQQGRVFVQASHNLGVMHGR